MGTTVRGTTQKGVRLTHTPSPLPSNGPAEPGLGSGPGSFGGGGDNVKGSAGNAVSSNMGPTGELPAAGKTPTGVRSTAG